MTILEKLIAIIAEEADKDPASISAASTFEDLGFDSLGVVEVILRVEDAFELSIPEETAHQFTCVGDVAKWVEGCTP